MKVCAYLMMPFCFLVMSCGASGSDDSPTDPKSTSQIAGVRTLPTDQDTIAKVFDPTYSVPTGFFVDERASTSQSYTVHHVMDESISYEVCSDDFDSAMALEAANNETRKVNGYYVGAYENDRYFEFIRELSYDDDVGNIADITSPGFARVFKCSNTVRDGVDRSLLTGYAGTLNSRPLGNDTVRLFAEYLWQFSFFPQRYKKVLDSHSEWSSTSPSHTLLLGFATNQGYARCDLIEVVEWRFSANRSSGEVTSQFDVIRTFEAELIDGSPRLCE